MSRDQRYLILADGLFGPESSKTANACIRYTPERVVGVIDATRAGRTASDVIGFGGDIPVVATLDEGSRSSRMRCSSASRRRAASSRPSGSCSSRARSSTASRSGAGCTPSSPMSRSWRRSPRSIASRSTTPSSPRAARSRARARAQHRRDGRPHRRHRLQHRQDDDAAADPRGASRQRDPHAFAATGQTGILIEGRGIAVDAVVADFIAGAAERSCSSGAKDADLVLVEGQGSIIHPSYSGVTYGLMHGSLPHAQIMCAQPSASAINGCEWVKIPPLAEFIRMSEARTRPAAPVARDRRRAQHLRPRRRRRTSRHRDRQRETGLPATDPVRFDPAPIVDAIAEFHRTGSGEGSSE